MTITLAIVTSFATYKTEDDQMSG